MLYIYASGLSHAGPAHVHKVIAFVRGADISSQASV